MALLNTRSRRPFIPQRYALCNLRSFCSDVSKPCECVVVISTRQNAGGSS